MNPIPISSEKYWEVPGCQKAYIAPKYNGINQPFFSLFRCPIQTTTPCLSINLADAYNYIISPYAKERTEQLRKITDTKQLDGYDPEQIMLILQNRSVDANGNIHVKRVGTAMLRISKSTNGWVIDKRIPVIYGDASKDPSFQSFMGLYAGKQSLYTVNSAGKSVPIPEEGWGDPDMPVTHGYFACSAGTQIDLSGALGNTLWVDNIRLEYE